MTPFTIALAYLMDKGHKAFQRFGTFVASAILPPELETEEREPEAAWAEFQRLHSEKGITATREIGARRKAKREAINAALKGGV